MKNSGSIKIIDNLIFAFFIIFLLTLTNSIFLNQLGYYSALVLTCARYLLTRENKFERTGLELPLILFLLIEILSAIFSDYSSAAFVNVFKRAILIPIIYITILVPADLEKAKLLFKIYLTASFITVIIYLFFSYQYYIANLYGQKESGPGIFQYPITASEIMSFTVIYFFSFFVNEKTSLRNKVLLFGAFALSALAVFATYKRTGWLGIAFGIFVILIIKKQWKIVIPIASACILIVFIDKDVSNIHIFSVENNLLKNEKIFKSGGRANSVMPFDGSYMVSDFENGLVKYSGQEVTGKVHLPAPVVSFNKWNDTCFYAGLADTRLVLMTLKNNNLMAGKIFLTKGAITATAGYGKYLYVLDVDSGLTIFKNPANLKDTLIFRKFQKYHNLLADSSYFIFYSPPDRIEIYANESDLPGKLIGQIKNGSEIQSMFYLGHKLYVSGKDELKIFDLNDITFSNVRITRELKNIVRWRLTGDNKLYAVDNSGYLMKLSIAGESVYAENKYKLSFIPQDFAASDSSLIILELKKSRIASVIDPYHPSNFGRFALWRAGFKMFLDHPLIGVGDIDLRNYFIKYKRDFDKDVQGHMHNNFIHVLVTLGLLGLIIVLYLFIKIIIIDFKIYNSVKNENFISSYALGTIGGFFAFMFAGLTELNFGDHEIITLIWFTFGLNYAFYTFFRRKKS